MSGKMTMILALVRRKAGKEGIEQCMRWLRGVVIRLDAAKIFQRKDLNITAGTVYLKSCRIAERAINFTSTS